MSSVELPPTVLIGCQGWYYPSWKKVFYEGADKKDWLKLYAQKFRVVELNMSRHGIPRADYVERWRDSTGDDFVFCAKFPEDITLDLDNGEQLTQEFLYTMQLFGKKLGTLLMQFPASFKFSRLDSLAKYLQALPKDFHYAVEIRNKTWLDDNGTTLQPAFHQLLSEHDISFTLTEAPFIPRLDVVTAKHSHIRLLGTRSDIPDDEYDEIRIDRKQNLSDWAEFIARLAQQGVTVTVVVNNHYAGHSPKSAEMLAQFVHQKFM